MYEKTLQLNEEVVRGQIIELVRGSVEETLNELLEAEAEKLTQAARPITYPTHFLSVYDLADPEESGDVFDYIAEDPSGRDPAGIIYRRVRRLLLNCQS